MRCSSDQSQSKQRRRRALFACATAAVGMTSLMSFTASGATHTWNGTTVTWNVAGNWQGGIPVAGGSTDVLFINQGVTGTSGTPLNQNVSNPLRIRSITFGNLASAFFLGGNGFDINDGSITITQSSANAQSIANTFTHTGGTNAVRTLTLDGNGTGIVTMSGVISDGNGSRKITITKSGSSTFVLSNTNTHDNGATINGGVLRITNANALGAGSVNINAGTLEIANLTLTANDITLNNGATLLGSGTAEYDDSGDAFPSIGTGASVTFATAGSGDVLTLDSAVRNGDAASLITVNGPGTVVLTSGATNASAYAGSWDLNGTSTTVLRLTSATALGNPNGGSSHRPIKLTNGTVQLRVDTGSTFTQATTVAGNVAVTPERGTSGVSNTHTMGSLTVSDGVAGVNTLTLTVNHGVNYSANNTGNLTFTGTTLTDNLSVVLNNTNGTAVGVTTLGAVGQTGGTPSLSKGGPGTLVLTGASTYTGTTTVSQGILRLNGSLSAGGGLVTVSATSPNTATLAGTATINRSVTIADRGSISPGAGDFSLSNFNANQASTTTTFDDGGAYVWQTNALPASGTAGVNWDHLTLNALSVSSTAGSKFTIKVVSVNAAGTTIANVTGLGPVPTSYTWTIATAATGISGFDIDKFALDTSQFNADNAGQWSLAANGNNLDLTLTVPEPSSAILAIGGLGMLMRRRRNRRV